MSILGSVRTKLIISLVFGFVVVTGMAVLSDLHAVGSNLGRFDWAFLPVVLALTAINYLLRFAKWHYYLGLIGARTLSIRQSLLIFLSGLAMVMTPGKVGELLKAYLLRHLQGTPVARSAPIVVAERLTDGLALLILASAGLVLYQYGWQILAVVLVGSLTVVVAARSQRVAGMAIRAAERLPLLAPRVRHLHTFIESARVLFAPRGLAAAVGLGTMSWSAECIAFFFVLWGLGFEPTLALLIKAAFILAAATLIGSVSMIPGGLGAADLSITGMLLLLITTPDMTRDIAVTATLLIRFGTLWFGVALGLICVVLFQHRFGAVAARGKGDDEYQAVPG